MGVLVLYLDEVKEGYDIGVCIGNIGISLFMVQIGFGLIVSYYQGGVSVMVNCCLNGMVSIIMVSLLDEIIKVMWVKMYGGWSFFE